MSLIFQLFILQSAFLGTFQVCQKNISIAGNDSLSVYSPNYPNTYTPGTSCEYIISTLPGFGLDLYCEINFYEDPGGAGCDTELFLFSSEEDPSLNYAEVFCGSAHFRRASLFLTATVAYVSRSPPYLRRGGNFRCQFKSRPRKCDCGWSLQAKIVGGSETQINEFPFMAGIVKLSSSALVCGGSISKLKDIYQDRTIWIKSEMKSPVDAIFRELRVTNRFILTSAHCLATVANLCDLAVLIGDHNYKTGSDTPFAKLLTVAKIIIHEGYQSVDFSNDIGLVLSREEMQWSRGVGPACLPFLNRYDTFVGYQVQIVGWGTTSFSGPTSDVLLEATTTIASNEQCSRVTSMNINASLFCTYRNGSDSCQGDSGGPVVLKSERMFLLGVIASGTTCSGLGFNERVTFYLDWITNHTKHSFCMKSIY